MSIPDPLRLAKLLEMAGHPSTSDGEALNSLRAARVLLARSGKSLADLSLSFRAPSSAQILAENHARDQIERLRAEVASLTAEAEQLARENRRLEKEAALVASLKAEVELLKEQGAARVDDPLAPAAGTRPSRMAEDLVALFDLLDNWRSITDLQEKLGPDLGPVGIKRLVRLLDDKGLLRVVDSMPPRYRLRPEGELGEDAREFRSRIEDARLSVGRAAVG